jgi:hypothetical protein
MAISLIGHQNHGETHVEKSKKPQLVGEFFCVSDWLKMYLNSLNVHRGKFKL